MLQQLNVVGDSCKSTVVLKRKADILSTSYDISIHQWLRTSPSKQFLHASGPAGHPVATGEDYGLQQVFQQQRTGGPPSRHRKNSGQQKLVFCTVDPGGPLYYGANAAQLRHLDVNNIILHAVYNYNTSVKHQTDRSFAATNI